MSLQSLQAKLTHYGNEYGFDAEADNCHSPVEDKV